MSDIVPVLRINSGEESQLDPLAKRLMEFAADEIECLRRRVRYLENRPARLRMERRLERIEAAICARETIC